MEAALDELVNKLQLGAEQFETAALILRTESEAKEAARILKEKLEKQGLIWKTVSHTCIVTVPASAKALQLLRFILQKVWNLTRYFPCSLQQIRARLQNRDVILLLQRPFINCICTNTENKYYKV